MPQRARTPKLTATHTLLVETERDEQFQAQDEEAIGPVQAQDEEAIEPVQAQDEAAIEPVQAQDEAEAAACIAVRGDATGTPPVGRGFAVFEDAALHIATGRRQSEVVVRPKLHRNKLNGRRRVSELPVLSSMSINSLAAFAEASKRRSVGSITPSPVNTAKKQGKASLAHLSPFVEISGRLSVD
jgi:hypothetical protein